MATTDTVTPPAPAAAQINKTPGVCGGDACVGNTRIPVWLLVEWRREGVTDEELVKDHYPSLTMADLAAAWWYYAEHRDEIEGNLRQQNEA